MPQSRYELEVLASGYQQRSEDLHEEYHSTQQQLTTTHDLAQHDWKQRLQRLEQQIKAYQSVPPLLYRITDRARRRAVAQRPFNPYERMVFARLTWWRQFCLFLLGWLIPALIARETEMLRELRQQSQRCYTEELRELRQNYRYLQSQADRDGDAVRAQRSHLMQIKQHIHTLQTRQMENDAKLQAAKLRRRRQP